MTPAAARAWVRLPSGRRLDLINPDPGAWLDSDLSFRAVSSRLMAAVSERYELRAWSPAAHAVHKRADSVAAASEAVHCIGWPAHEVRDVLGIVHPVLDVDPLAEIYGCRSWEPWAADVAAERFLAALESLRAAVHGQIEAQV